MSMREMLMRYEYLAVTVLGRSIREFRNMTIGELIAQKRVHYEWHGIQKNSDQDEIDGMF
jgi:hypothetical protein